jgi:hypothetical protein
MFLAPSKLPGAGLGVFSGRNWKKDELVLSESRIITLPLLVVKQWPLYNYVYGTKKTYL